MVRVASLLGLEKSKPVPTHFAASDGNELVGGEPRRDEETSSLYRIIVGALLYMGHDRSDAACAIRLLACDLCAANEDSLRRFKKGSCGICTTQANSQLSTLYVDRHVMEELVALANSDWAGDRNTRKSATCVALQVDGCVPQLKLMFMLQSWV